VVVASNAPPVLSFLGAAGTVTGSRFLVDTPDHRILVDCGLYQGRKDLRLRNWSGLGVGPASIDAVVLTHAHVDHCGYLPAIVRDGFSGPIYCTPDTAELVRIMLPDSARLAEEEARFANRKGYSRHQPALPLFTEDDADKALLSLVTVPFGEEHGKGGWSFRFGRAGHILGSAWARIQIEGDDPRSVVFTGDLGRSNHPLLLPPDPRPVADVVVSESTYGSREHEKSNAADELGEIIRRTIKRKGTVVIPAFAVDRTDVVLHHLARLSQSGSIPEVPIKLDSPMASRALWVYREAFLNGSPDARPELVGTHPFEVRGLDVISTIEESKSLNDDTRPMIIISASGMLTGGRVVHHVAHRIDDPRNTIVLIGYQAEGTRGRRLAEGATTLKMLGRYWPVRAEVAHLSSMSVHADRGDLISWLSSGKGAPDIVYAVHGEPESSAGLVQAIDAHLGWPAVAPLLDERVRLD
jgi:metallo-beta-lactamase family protein